MSDEPKQLPTTCQECLATEYKLPDYRCAFEKVKQIKEAKKFFANHLRIDMVMHLNGTNSLDETIAVLWAEAKQCISDIPIRAPIAEQKKQQQQFNKRVTVLESGIREILEKIKSINTTNDHIFKDEKEMTTPVRQVRTSGDENEFKMKFAKKDNTPKSKWKRYQPNVKKENVNKYLNKLATVHPGLKDEINKVMNNQPSNFVRVAENKFGNKVIEYKDI